MIGDRDPYTGEHSGLAPKFDPTAVNSADSTKQPPNPYAPYTYGNRQTSTYTFVGVPDDYMVYRGKVPDYQPVYRGAGYGMPGDPLTNQAYSFPQYTYEALNALNGAPEQQIIAVQEDLYNHGYLSKANLYNDAGHYTPATQEALGHAMAAANKEGISLDELFARSKAGDAVRKMLDAKSGAQPRDIASTSIRLTGREGAQQVLTQALTDQLGREPTPNEVTRFLNSLNQEERANPTVTRTHYDASGAATSSVTTETDVSPSGAAEAFAKSGPYQAERHQYQDALYFDVLHNMLGGGG